MSLRTSIPLPCYAKINFVLRARNRKPPTERRPEGRSLRRAVLGANKLGFAERQQSYREVQEEHTDRIDKIFVLTFPP